MPGYPELWAVAGYLDLLQRDELWQHPIWQWPGLLQRGIKQLESQNHTSCCSFTSRGSIHHAEPRAAHLTRDTLVELLLSAHASHQTQLLCAQLVPTTSPPKTKHQHQHTTSLGHAWETPAGLLSPSKLQANSFFAENTRTGRAEPPATCAGLRLPGLRRCPFPWLCLLSQEPGSHAAPAPSRGRTSPAGDP